MDNLADCRLTPLNLGDARRVTTEPCRQSLLDNDGLDASGDFSEGRKFSPTTRREQNLQSSKPDLSPEDIKGITLPCLQRNDVETYLVWLFRLRILAEAKGCWEYVLGGKVLDRIFRSHGFNKSLELAAQNLVTQKLDNSLLKMVIKIDSAADMFLKVKNSFLRAAARTVNTFDTE